MSTFRRILLSIACLWLAACASLPPSAAGDDEAGFRNVREQAHYRVRVREGMAPLPEGSRFRLPVVRVVDDGTGPGISEAQAGVVATHAARSVCLVLSPWVRWVDDDDAGRVALDVRRIGQSSSGLAATSAVIDAVVPGPFRLPAGLGALEVDSRIEAADGTPVLELRWARGANPLLHRARASSIGDAWELAPSHARDLKAALAALRPVAQADDAVEAPQDFLVMRHRDDGGLLLDGQLVKQVHHDAGALGVERGCRLVGENDAGTVGERPGNRHALSFTA